MKRHRRPTTRVVRPVFPVPEPDLEPHVNTPEQDLGLTLCKIRVLAEVISLDGSEDPAIVADCILDELTIAEELQQDLEGAAIARRREPAQA